MARGISAKALAALNPGGKIAPGVHFTISRKFTASDSDFAMTPSGGLGFPFRVIDAYAVMTGAGGAGDTWKLTDGTNDITDTVDVSSAADKDIVPAGQLDDAYYRFSKTGEVRGITASGAEVELYAICVRTD